MLLKEKRRGTFDNPDDLDEQLHITSSEDLVKIFPTNYVTKDQYFLHNNNYIYYSHYLKTRNTDEEVYLKRRSYVTIFLLLGLFGLHYLK